MMTLTTASSSANMVPSTVATNCKVRLKVRLTPVITGTNYEHPLHEHTYIGKFSTSRHYWSMSQCKGCSIWPAVIDATDAKQVLQLQAVDDVTGKNCFNTSVSVLEQSLTSCCWVLSKAATDVKALSVAVEKTAGTIAAVENA